MNAMIIKTVYPTFNPEIYKSKPTPFKMFYKRSVGWVAMESAASTYTRMEELESTLETVLATLRDDSEVYEFVDIRDRETGEQI